MSSPIIGIDFGTTSSAVAAFVGGVPHLIPDLYGNSFLPSLAVVRDDGELFVGHEAVVEARRYSGKSLTVGSLKRQMDKSSLLRCGDIRVSPLILSSLVLAELRLQAEVHFGRDINQAVIAVPANFGFFQRQFTKEAALIAGLDPLKILNEATAAVCMLPNRFEGVVVAADLGGGTFDVSVIETGEGVAEVITTTGDERLGGDDFTDTLVKIVYRKAGGNFDFDFSGSDPNTRQRIRDVVEESKHLLSGSDAVEVRIPILKTRRGGYANFECTITRQEFEHDCGPLIKRMESLVEQAWRDAEPRIKKQAAPQVTSAPGGHKNPTPVYSGIWMLGNASRMPAISRALRTNHPVRPASIGDLKAPVALGAARMAGVLCGAERNLLLLDVTARALGTSTGSGDFIPLIDHNVTLPYKACRNFTTVAANQSRINVPILEKLHPNRSETRQIGIFRLEGFWPCPAGKPRIEVTFDLDVDGVLSVSGKDLATGKASKLRCDGLELSESTLNQYHRLVQDWYIKRKKRYGKDRR